MVGDHDEDGDASQPVQLAPMAEAELRREGGLGVVDPVTLAWRYYVKLSPAEISNAMWAEVSPDGRWVWTSSGTDLLAYSAAEVSAANAGPNGTPLTAHKRVAGVLRAPSVSGAAFHDNRLDRLVK